MKPKIKARKYAYRIYKLDSDWQFQHVTIDILAPSNEWSQPGDMETLFSLVWQSDREGGFGKWYGMKFATEKSSLYASRLPAHITSVSKIVSKLFNSDSGEMTPWTVLSSLESLKIDRVSYDGRLSAYVSEQEAPNVEWFKYIDDRKIASGGDENGCCVSCVAPDAETAQRMLVKEWAELVSGGSESYAIRYSDWLKADKPVVRCEPRYNKPAEFIPVASILNEPATTNSPTL